MSAFMLKTGAVAMLLATSSLFSTVSAASTTCVDNVSNGATFEGFKIVCGVDHEGGDLTALYSPSFEGCIQTCKTTPSCIDVSYVGDNNGGSCYLKSQLRVTPVNAAHVWTAVKIIDPATQPTVITCIDQKSDGTSYKSANGKVFKIMCGHDYEGGDLVAASTESFAACMDICSTTKDCIDISYVNGACYLKNTLMPLKTAAHVWTGLYDTAASPVVPSTTTATGTAPTTTAAASLSCDNGRSDKKEFKSTTGSLYLIECGVDYAGGDMQSSEVASFEDCISACDKASGCIDVSFVAPSCYMKSTLNPAVSAGHVWSAKFLKAAEPEPTPTPTPTPIVVLPPPGPTDSTTGGPIQCAGDLPATDVAGRAKLQYYIDGVYGHKYETHCRVDYGGNDRKIFVTADWKSCVEACSAYGPTCAGISWVPSRPRENCYIKFAMGNRISDSILGFGVWSSVKVSQASQVSQVTKRAEIGSVAAPVLRRRDVERKRRGIAAW